MDFSIDNYSNGAIIKVWALKGGVNMKIQIDIDKRGLELAVKILGSTTLDDTRKLLKRHADNYTEEDVRSYDRALYELFEELNMELLQIKYGKIKED